MTTTTTAALTLAEYREIFDRLADLVTYGEGCEAACAACPYRERCHETASWYGCGIWEEGMGDDL